jgi:hypothetical protein
MEEYIMASVTQRISQIKQPLGGYINSNDFTETVFHDGILLKPEENIHASLVGITVDYLTRYMMGTPTEKAFIISLKGSLAVREEKKAKMIMSNIKGLDNQSIICACKLAGYDVCFRAGITGFRPVDNINADENTIFNIRTMVNRSLVFWENYGPIIKDGFTFDGGYTSTVSAGDGDYLSQDTLWDFKVLKDKPNNKHTLQLLMYYIMGCRSVHNEFKSIKNLGIYNPRKNTVYLLEIAKVEQSLIDEVSTDVIGYSSTVGMVIV